MVTNKWFVKILSVLLLSIQIGCVRFIILHDPLTAEEHNDLGVAYLNEKEYEAAEREFKRAIKKDRFYWLAHYNLGTLYLQNNNAKAAEQHFYKAIIYNHECADAYNNLALAELERNDGKHALYFIQLALQYAKEDRHRYLDTLAAVYEHQLNREEACSALRAAIEEAPEKEKTLYRARYEQRCLELFIN